MKYIKLFIVLGALCTAAACVDDDKLFELDDFDKGALLNFTQTANDPGLVDILDLENAMLEFSVDFRNDLVQDTSTGAQGSGRQDPNLEFTPVASFDVVVRWRRPSTGQVSEGVLSTGNNSWPAVLNFTATDLVGAIVDINSVEDIKLDDIFTITSTIHTQDGRTLPGFLPDGNSNPTLAYSTSYPGQPGITLWLNYTVACGVANDFAVGTYRLEYSGPVSPFGLGSERFTSASGTGEVEITGTGTKRSFAISYWSFAANFSFDLICGVALVPNTAAPVSCSGNLSWNQAAVLPEGIDNSFDLESDAEFTLVLDDDIANDCGANAPSVILKLTKI